MADGPALPAAAGRGAERPRPAVPRVLWHFVPDLTCRWCLAADAELAGGSSTLGLAELGIPSAHHVRYRCPVCGGRWTITHHTMPPPPRRPAVNSAPTRRALPRTSDPVPARRPPRPAGATTGESTAMNPTSATAQAVKDAVREALTAGADVAEVRRTVEAAAGTSASLAGGWDFLLAPVLFALALEAKRQGQDEQADTYTRLNVQWCRPEAVRVAKLGGLLAAGQGQGWLPAEQYDEVAELLAGFAETSPHRATLAGIARREP